MFKDEAFNRCWSKYYKEHSWNYMDEELSFDLAYYFWKSALEQPTAEQSSLVQEPVGEVCWHEGTVMGSIYPTSNMPKDGDKLYTHPPKEWQRLSDDEILKAIAPKGTADSDWNALKFCDDLITIGRAIEQALKEKNG
jgi:hypothetical protein